MSVTSGITPPRVLVRGAGVSGLVTAVALAERGAVVTLSEKGARIGSGASWFAGGMLAPWCEAESAPDVILDDAVASIAWWRDHVPDVAMAGTLVVAQPRDVPELTRFGRRTSHFDIIDEKRIATLEPDLGQRFSRGLFFEGEGHLDPRLALHALRARLLELGGVVHLEETVPPGAYDRVVDCTGIAARSQLGTLRGVRGEMVLLRCEEVSLQRPVRLLHPRIPVYIVPRAHHVFMVGATMVESDDTRAITVRAVSDLLNAVYAIHPAFAEAEVLEANAGLRPSFPDNLPRVVLEGKTIHVNGMYRHGFLLAPARAQEAVDHVFDGWN